MTREQQKKVEDNMGLIGKVIQDKVHGTNLQPVYSYEDLFQTGCVGLCKAVITDKGGCFSTYAYRLIWNEICDELIRATRLIQKEDALDSADIPLRYLEPEEDMLQRAELQQALTQAKKSASGVTAKGIQCIELSAQGYTSNEIASIMKAEAATIRMWMTKARRFLRELPELQGYGNMEVIGC